MQRLAVIPRHQPQLEVGCREQGGVGQRVHGEMGSRVASMRGGGEVRGSPSRCSLGHPPAGDARRAEARERVAEVAILVGGRAVGKEVHRAQGVAGGVRKNSRRAAARSGRMRCQRRRRPLLCAGARCGQSQQGLRRLPRCWRTSGQHGGRRVAGGPGEGGLAHRAAPAHQPGRQPPFSEMAAACRRHPHGRCPSSGPLIASAQCIHAQQLETCQSKQVRRRVQEMAVSESAAGTDHVGVCRLLSCHTRPASCPRISTST